MGYRARVLGAGVMAARTLLESNRTQATARVLNYSDESYTLAVDSFLAVAEPVSVAEETGQEPVRDDELETGPTSEPDRRAPVRIYGPGPTGPARRR